MTEPHNYRALSNRDIELLERCGCTAEGNDWTRVQVTDPFDPARIVATHFGGQVQIGALTGVTHTSPAKPSAIQHACLIDCVVGDHVRIVNVGVHICNYDIGAGASIENIGTLEARTGADGAKFGNGVEIEVLNEGGGREVILFNELSSQFAHLLCLHRYRPRFIARLREIAEQSARRAHTGRGRIGVGASIRSVTEMIDVHVGPAAIVNGATSLVNGSILSSPEAPTLVGPGVQADSFIIAEGARVTGGALVAKSYIGQGTQVGRQFSAEGSLLFANCEAFHGEACSVFAGPYTVTHHKGSLLIAGLFSFYNAGSGTNQSNHMYKLGPVHEGRVERGAKTGSFSYMMWPCRVGPFCVVLGKHTRAFDTADFPFSHIEALPDGRCSLIPGFNLTTVGTVRDGAKWPTRDRRQGPVKRDRLSFDVFSPYTVGRMLRGMEILHDFQQKTDRSVGTVAIGGAEVKRVFLRTGLKIYRRGALMYLTEKIVARLERAWQAGPGPWAAALGSAPDAVFSSQWVDVGGLLMPAARLETLVNAVENGSADLVVFNTQLDQIQTHYAEDEWVWVKWAYQQLTEVNLDTAGSQELLEVADTLLSNRKEFLEAVLADAVKEFDRHSAIGFGTDGPPEALDGDFQAVRGDYDTNKFVLQLRSEIEQLGQRVEQFRRRIAG
ncbi:MAG: DUF4954 family protein [Pirellulaceae bacterium]